MRLHLMAEAERSRFEANMKGEKPKLYFRCLVSDFDPSTNFAFTWDIWVRFPFKLLKEDEKMKKFKEMIQDAFEKVFLSQEKR